MKAGWLWTLCLLAACGNQTSIQSAYLSERDACQSEAEDTIDDYMSEGDDIRVRNAKLVTLFSDCMFEHGWTVAAPDRAGGGGDTSVGVGDTIKPGQTVAPPVQQTAPAPAYAPPVAAAPVHPPALPAPPPGYQYQLVPVPAVTQ